MRLHSVVARARLLTTFKKALAAVVVIGGGGGGGGNASSLLLHFDGSGPYDIFDSSANTIAVPNANSVYAQPVAAKFGSRGLVTGGSSLTVANDSRFANLTGDFTVDLWANGVSGANGFFYLSSNNPDFGNMTAFGLISSTYGNRLALWNSTGGPYTSIAALGTANIASFGADTLVHIAMTRQGDQVRFFVNGTIDKQFTYSAAINFGRFSGDVLIGAGPSSGNPSTGAPAGYIDEFRVINVYAAWTDTFTPPTAPYAS
jgi:hypothetical protein